MCAISSLKSSRLLSHLLMRSCYTRLSVSVCMSEHKCNRPGCLTSMPCVSGTAVAVADCSDLSSDRRAAWNRPNESNFLTKLLQQDVVCWQMSSPGRYERRVRQYITCIFLGRALD